MSLVAETQTGHGVPVSLTQHSVEELHQNSQCEVVQAQADSEVGTEPQRLASKLHLSASKWRGRLKDE